MAKHKKHDEEHMSEAWLIPYADVLTLLLAVFIILFSTSQSDTKKFQEVAEIFGQVFKGSPFVIEGYTGKEIVPMDNAGKDGGASNTEANESLNQGADAAQQSQNAAAAAAQSAMEADMREMVSEIREYIAEHDLGTELEVRMTGGSELDITIKEKTLFASGRADITDESRAVLVSIADILQAHPSIMVTVKGHTDNVPISSAVFSSNWSLSSARATAAMEVLIHDSGLNPAAFHSEGYGEYQPVGPNETEEGRRQNRRVEISIKGNIDQSSMSAGTDGTDTGYDSFSDRDITAPVE